MKLHRLHSKKQRPVWLQRGTRFDRRGGKLGGMVGSQALGSPDGQSKHPEMYYIGKPVKDFVGGKK